MKTIPLTQGQFALVDDADYAAVSAFKWCALRDRRNVYAVRGVKKSPGVRTLLRLHSFLMPGIPQIDHRDGNGLNCQRDNLRPATGSQNARAARRKQIGRSSAFRGVSWDKAEDCWRARIWVGGRNLSLGCFVKEDEAAQAYDRASRQHFGEFAAPNFPRHPGRSC
jgi:hypothetical protein